MSEPHKEVTELLLKHLKEQADEDRKEKARARRPTYLRWGVICLSICFGIFMAVKAWNRVDRFTDLLPTAPTSTYANSVQAWKGEATVLILPIQGTISGHPIARSEPKGVMSMFSDSSNMVLAVKSALSEASVMKNLAELVIYVDSPGGGVTASDEIYSMIRAWRAKHPHIPVTAYFYQMAASGGYYVAMAADTIVASPTSLVGSISVIMQMPNISELAKKLGVDMTTIKTGKIKDIGNMFREMSDDGRAVLQRLADQSHARFVGVVGEGRPKLPRAQIEEIADGRILSSGDALQAGLIDSIAPTFEDFMAKRVQGIMERQKVRKVYIMYPGNNAKEPEIVVEPK